MSRSRRHRWLWSTAIPLALVLVLGLGACGKAPESDNAKTTLIVDVYSQPMAEATELSAMFPGAEVRLEQTVLQLGAQASGARHRGWGAPEDWGGRPFAWATAPRGLLDFYVSSPRDLELVLDLWQHPRALLEGQTVEVRVNEEVLGTVLVPSKPRQMVTLDVPASLLEVGNNRLGFSYSEGFRPVEAIPGSEDERTLYAAWGQVEFRGLNDPPVPKVRRKMDQEDSIVLPVGSEVRFYFAGPGKGALSVSEIRGAGFGDKLELEVDIVSPDGDLHRRLTQQGPMDFDYDFPGSGPLAMIFRIPARPGAKSVLVRGGKIVPDVASHPAPLSPSKTEPPSLTLARPGSSAHTNVVVFVIDTLRADHLGAYGYGKEISPHIDAFSQDAVLFEDARAQASWTRPSMASLFTSLWPTTHGAEGERDILPEQATTLAERFQSAGFQTGAVVTNGIVSEKFGFGRGFDNFHFLPERHRTAEIHRPSEDAVEVAEEWLGKRNTERPFFLWVHTIDPHAPYLPPTELLAELGLEVEDRDRGLHPFVEGLHHAVAPVSESIRRDLVTLYDAEIARNDRAFGSLIDILRRLEIYDDTMVLLVSDHGEEFGEHGGWQHGFTLYQEQLWVPMILKLPQRLLAGARVRGPVRLIDVGPTLAELQGWPEMTEIDGRSLVLAMETGIAAPLPMMAHLTRQRISSLEASGRKWISYQANHRAGPLEEFFDLTDDPGELTSRAEEFPVWSGFLSAWARALQARSGHWEVGVAEIDEETRKNLRALGYLQ